MTELWREAIRFVLENEGGFVDDPQDPGGATRYGIAQKHNPTVDVRNLTVEGAVQIYHERYWRRWHYHDWPRGLTVNQRAVVVRTFDHAINRGRKAGAFVLQRALRACEVDADISGPIDGIIGEKTRRAVRTVHGFALLCALRSERAGDYRRLRKNLVKRFGTGWENRAYR